MVTFVRFQSLQPYVVSGGVSVCVLRVSEIDPEKPPKCIHMGAYLYVPDICVYIHFYLQFCIQYKGGRGMGCVTRG